MPANRKINNVRGLKFRCRYDNYYDFMLYRGECYGDGSFGDCLVADIDADCIAENGKIYSRARWNDATSTGVSLKDIGLTGIDNGFIYYNKEEISNEEFLNILTGSTYDISDGDGRLFLSPITGNTGNFEYPTEVVEEEGKKYISFKGGFYQGFYKLFGFDYQTLPSYVDNEWNLQFVIRRRPDYETGVNTLNALHPENKGIFFYMGTRAENKFWHLYRTEGMDKYLIPNAVDDGYFADWDLKNHATDYDYLQKEDNDEYAVDEEYWAKEKSLKDVEVKTSAGHDADKKGYFEIETDNKFILFNRTCTGYTVNNWDEDATIILTGRTDADDENYFITFNRTCTGKTVNDVDENDTATTKPYDVQKDSKGNSFALRVDDDGRIGFKMSTPDCEAEDGYGVKEAYSKEGVVPAGEWVNVVVKVKIINPYESQCISDSGTTITYVPMSIGNRKMKLYFYVNGYLSFVSDELPEFNFRELDDVYQKQEGVPFNISLGGGTQGLLEEIFTNYYDSTSYCLPIEKNFGGTFLGDIRLFRFFPCFMDYATVKKLPGV
jgi:hypothetical protein